SFVVEEDGEPVGYVQAWTDDGGHSGGIDLVLLPAAYGRGLGPDAGRALAQQLVRRGWDPVTVDPALDNLVAIRAWEKAGFVSEGEWPDHPAGRSLRMSFRRYHRRGGRGSGSSRGDAAFGTAAGRIQALR